MNTCTGCHTECPGGSSDPQGRGRSRGHWCSVHSSTHQYTGHMIPFLRINMQIFGLNIKVLIVL